MPDETTTDATEPTRTTGSAGSAATDEATLGPASGRKALVIGVTTDDDRFAATRKAAMEIAADQRAALILYNWDAATVLGSALPTEWSGEGSDESIPDRLDEAALEAAGRAEIAGQVAEARRMGIEASAWLPSKKGPDGLVDYAEEQRATTIVVPADLHSKGGLEQLGETVSDGPPAATVEGRSPARVIVVPAPTS